MSCMKCGRDTAPDQVFCQDCLLAMQTCPVDPATVIQLPIRRERSAGRKNAKRRAPGLEEQVKSLKRRLRAATIAIITLLALLAGTAYPALRYVTRDRRPAGQNYSVTEPSGTASTETAPETAGTLPEATGKAGDVSRETSGAEP